MIRLQASVSKGWLHANAGFQFPEKYYLDPLFRYEQDRKIDAYLRTRFPSTPLYNMEDNLVQQDYVVPNQVLFDAMQPNLLVAALLGASFHFDNGLDPDVNGAPLAEIHSADELPSPERLLDHPLLDDFRKRFAELSRERPDLRPIPPFFWDTSGRGTIHGIITTSFKLVGQNIFLLMSDRKELVHAIHRWIVDCYTVLLRHFSEAGRLPITSVHVGECSGIMLSPSKFEEFVVPYLTLLGREFGALRLHSCGNSDRLLPAMARVENVRILDVGSGTSLAKIRGLFGPSMEINTFPALQLLRRGMDREAVLEWYDKIREDNAGGPLQIAFHLEEDYDLENCLAIHEAVQNDQAAPCSATIPAVTEGTLVNVCVTNI
ncbi:MAG: uroporphyrinogen decarboxylase family protein [Planctomycetaceae bacterium]|nr:uroporphyrinogen decarboxylase family protein [Planctomycetaceae bacterium]